MKRFFLAVVFLFSVNVNAQGVNSFDCGFLVGLVAGAEGIAYGEISGNHDVYAWAAVYKYNLGKIDAFRSLIQKHVEFVSDPGTKNSLAVVLEQLGSIVDTPTRTGDVYYWASMFEQQQSDFLSVLRGIKLTRDRACQAPLLEYGY